ncbi:hypothetical protein Dimus_005560 [Dionaea muscipula]
MLVPPFWVRKRDTFVESWEEGIWVHPAVCACKRESEFLHSRILLKRFNRAIAEDGKPPEKLGCRRYSRLSSYSPSSSSDLGSRVASKLSPVAEMVSSSPDVFSLSFPDGEQEVIDGLAGEHGGGAMVAGDVLSEPLIMGRAVDGVDDGKGFELLKKPSLIGGAAVGSTVTGCEVQACSSSSTELPFLEDAGESTGQVDSTFADGGKLSVVVASIAEAGVVLPVTVVSCVPLPTLSGGDVGFGDDGLVSEEGRVAPVAREALRPPPTDGLRHLPTSPVEPVIVGGDATKGSAPGGTATKMGISGGSKPPPIQGKPPPLTLGGGFKTATSEGAAFGIGGGFLVHITMVFKRRL